MEFSHVPTLIPRFVQCVTGLFRLFRVLVTSMNILQMSVEELTKAINKKEVPEIQNLSYTDMSKHLFFLYIKLKTYNTYYLITVPTKYFTLLLKQYHLERKFTSTKWQHKTKNTNIALDVTTLKDKEST